MCPLMQQNYTQVEGECLNDLIVWQLKQTLTPDRTNQLTGSITTLVLVHWATNYEGGGWGGVCWDPAGVMAEESA